MNDLHEIERRAFKRIQKHIPNERMRAQTGPRKKRASCALSKPATNSGNIEGGCSGSHGHVGAVLCMYAAVLDLVHQQNEHINQHNVLSYRCVWPASKRYCTEQNQKGFIRCFMRYICRLHADYMMLAPLMKYVCLAEGKFSAGLPMEQHLTRTARLHDERGLDGVRAHLGGTCAGQGVSQPGAGETPQCRACSWCESPSVCC